MDYSRVFAISAAGMGFERTRVEVAAMNLANANTAQGPSGRYVVQRVVADPVQTAAAHLKPDAPFAAMVDQALAGDAGAAANLSLPLARLIPAEGAPRRVHDPGHPLADEGGFVPYPAVDPAMEMVELMSATRAYEANIVAMNTAKTLAMRALEIGGNNA